MFYKQENYEFVDTHLDLSQDKVQIVYHLIFCGFKGTVSREKFFNWGLWVMVKTLTFDRSLWVLHFSDQLFSSYKCLTDCRLDVKPVSDFQELMRSTD